MPEEANAKTVSQAMGLAKASLEQLRLRVIGEVSELSINPRYKAVYFTIKDEQSSMSCMMWNNRYSQSGIQLEIGSLVEITGRFTLYAAKGRMNFDVASIELAGEGRLRMQVAMLAKRLQSEGLMAPEAKLPIPKFPSSIGIVTSPRGAAVYDMLRTLRRRSPMTKVYVAGVSVEGSTAPRQMADALKILQDVGVEVILLARGGGSFEDLMPFNDEELARAIFASNVPIVTGIGHEPDNSIADMVSDFRASTPTAAAEAVSASAAEVSIVLQSLSVQANSAIKNSLSTANRGIEHILGSYSFKEPQRLFSSQAQGLDDLSKRLPQAIPSSFISARVRLSVLSKSLKLGLSSLVQGKGEAINGIETNLISSMDSNIKQTKSKIARETGMLQALSPLAVLERGYSITSTKEGHIVKNIAYVEIGQTLDILVSDGTLTCDVLEKKEQPS